MQQRHASFSWRLFALVLAASCIASPARAGDRVYNAQSAGRHSKLNVHIIPHSHNDPGWLQTYDSYHRGYALQAKPGDELRAPVAAGVDSILEAVVASLLLHPERTFVIADLAFFVRWWREQGPGVRGKVRQLVDARQLEFVNGGLVQHDEATSHYSAVVGGLDAGMRFLREELGVEPRTAWMIDGFGHSRSEALLRAQGGFDALFFTRAAQKDMEQRQRRHQMELVWRGSDAFGAEADLFVSQSPSGTYTTPSDEWMRTSSDAGALLPNAVTLLDDGSPALLSGEHGAPSVPAMVRQFETLAEAWRDTIPAGQNDVMFYMGGDFAFKDATAWYRFMDKLIAYVNQHGALNVMYSTPERFLQAKHSAATAARQHASKPAWALQASDFFPYQCELGVSWTGFFSSRPTLKGMIRQAAAVLQATRQLEVIAGLPPATFAITPYKGVHIHGAGRQEAADSAADSAAPEFVSAVEAFEASQVPPGPDASVLEFAVAVTHHHDAITGTQKLHVRDDYVHWLHVGLHKAVPKMLLCLQQLVFGSQLLPQHPTDAAANTRHASKPRVQQPGHPPARRRDVQPTAGRSLLAPPDEGDGWKAAFEGAAADLAQLHGTGSAADAGDGSKQSGEQLLTTDVITSPDGPAGVQLPQLSYCLLVNNSLCTATVDMTAGGSGFALVAFNPLSWPARQGVRLPVAGVHCRYAVTGPGNAAVASQLLPLPPHIQATWRAHNLTHLAASHAHSQQLAFQVDVPALGHAVYRVQAVQEPQAEGQRTADAGRSSSVQPLAASDADVTLTNGVLRVVVSPAAGGITGVTMLPTGKQHSYSQQLVLYESHGLFKTPGAYVFSTAPQSRVRLPPPQLEIVRGPVVTEVRQTWRRGGERLGSVTTRLFNGSDVLEVEWSVGPPPGGLNPDRANASNWDVFLRHESSSIESAGVWFTDANGLEWQQRRRGFQPSYEAAGKTEMASNLYPMTTGALIKDVQASMYVSTDRAQGVTSLADGQLDVLLHRVSELDDGKGMDERLMDATVPSGKHLVWFCAHTGAAGREKGSSQTQWHARHHQLQLAAPLQLAFATLPAADTAVHEASSFLAAATQTQQAAGSSSWPSLPANVHVLSLQWRSCSSIMLRLAHVFQAGEAPHSSLDGEALVRGLFEPGAPGQRLQQARLGVDGVVSIREVTLFGGRPLEAADCQPGRAWPLSGERVTRWEPPVWPPRTHTAAAEAAGGADSFLSNRIVGPVPSSAAISLRPMQIRSFVLTVSPQHSSCQPATSDGNNAEPQAHPAPVVAAVGFHSNRSGASDSQVTASKRLPEQPLHTPEAPLSLLALARRLPACALATLALAACALRVWRRQLVASSALGSKGRLLPRRSGSHAGGCRSVVKVTAL